MNNNIIYQSISGLLSVLIINLVFYRGLLIHQPSPYSLSGIICCRCKRYIRTPDLSFPILVYQYNHPVYSLFYTSEKRLASKHTSVCDLGYHRDPVSSFVSNTNPHYSAADVYAENRKPPLCFCLLCPVSFHTAPPTFPEFTSPGKVLRDNYGDLFCRTACKHPLPASL